MNSTCIRTVFKMKSWNFTGSSTTPWDRSWRGWRFYRSPHGVENKGLITQKTWIRRVFAQFSRWRVETSQERRRLLGTGRESVDDSTVPPYGVENKGLTSLSVCLCLCLCLCLSQCIRTVFKLRSSTSQDHQRLLGTGRGGVGDSTVPPRGQK